VRDPPGRPLGPKDRRDPQRSRDRPVAVTDLRLEPLYLDEIRKRGGDAGHQRLEAGRSTIAVVRRRSVHGLLNPLPPHDDWTEWIAEAGVFASGVQPLGGLRIPAEERVERVVILIDEGRQIRIGHAGSPTSG